MQWRALSQVFCNSMSTMDNACKWNVTEKRGGGELSEAQKNKKCCGSLALWQKIPPVLKFCNSMIFSSGNSTKNHHCTGSWAKQRLRAAGLDTQVLKVSGNVSAPGKSKAMDNFRAGWELIALYCTPTKLIKILGMEVSYFALTCVQWAWMCRSSSLESVLVHWTHTHTYVAI